jgi:hypothetical protein
MSICDDRARQASSAKNSRGNRVASADLISKLFTVRPLHPYDALQGSPSVVQHPTIDSQKVNWSKGQIVVAALLLFALLNVAVAVQERYRQRIVSPPYTVLPAAAVDAVAFPPMQQAPALQARGASPPRSPWPTIGELRPLYDALYARESSSGEDLRDGDGGESRGPYQIQLAHWTDSGIDLPYERFCRNKMVCEIEMYGYWQRRCPRALRERDFEILARFHNGGPEHWRSQDAANYWRDVKQVLTARDEGNAK